METYDFDTPVERRGTNSLKFDCAEMFHRPADALPLWVADMDFRTPDVVMDAICARARHGVFGYTMAGPEYLTAVANWMHARHAWDIEPEWIVTAPGVVFALSAAVPAFTQPGEAVLIQPPVYYPFARVVRDNDRVLAESPLVYEDGRYAIDFAAFERTLETSGAKLFIFCSPHNPVGRVWREDELRQLGDICLAHGVTIVSDEIHMDFERPGQVHVPLASLSPELAQATVTMTSASKSFNLAGLQTANVVAANERLRGQLKRAIAVTGYDEPNVLGLEATRAAYEQGAPWFDALKEYLEGNWDLLARYLEERIPQLKLVPAEGTYLAWIDCRSLGMDARELRHFMLEDAKLWLDQGDMFGTEGAGFVRVNLATQRANLQRALEQLEAAVNRLA